MEEREEGDGGKWHYVLKTLYMKYNNFVLLLQI